MMDMPRVGTTIRVTLTYGSGTREIYEGTVTRTPDDGLGIVELGSGVRVALNDRLGRTVTVEELEPPKPTLPPEPPYYAVVGNDWTKPNNELFLHCPTSKRDDDAEYFDLLAGDNYVTWDRVVELVPDPVRWLPVPDLAELVDAVTRYRDSVHASGRHPGSADHCDAISCAGTLNPLLKRVGGES